MDQRRPQSFNGPRHARALQAPREFGPNWRLSGILAEDAAAKGLSPGNIVQAGPKAQSPHTTSLESPADMCTPPVGDPYKITAYGAGAEELGSANLTSSRGRWTLGRDPKSDIAIEGSNVLPKHAVLLFRKPTQEKRLYLVIYGETRINGVQIPRGNSHRLAKGDILSLGGSLVDLHVT